MTFSYRFVLHLQAEMFMSGRKERDSAHQGDALGLRGEQDDEEGHDNHPGGEEEEDAPLRTQPVSYSAICGFEHRQA